LNLSHDTLMHCGTCHALETSAIDALNGHPTRLCRPRQGHDPCIVATSRDPNAAQSRRVTPEKCPHRMQAVDVFATSHEAMLLRKLEIDEPLDRIGVRDDHAHGRADPEPSPRAATQPGMTTGLHYVFVVTEGLDTQQPINA